MTEISLIAFDADDTLWGSQTYFKYSGKSVL